MRGTLRVSIGQYSDKGAKSINQDSIASHIPQDHSLHTKGVVAAIADGISSSDVSHEASAIAVYSFIDDYYCTPESWSLKLAAQRVLFALNSWLCSQTRAGSGRFNSDKGHVCTFSALILKARRAHIFHLGDTRVCFLAGQRLEQLTNDHRSYLSDGGNYLSRALGAAERLEVDFHQYPTRVGDVFLLMSDGVYEHVADPDVALAIEDHSENLDRAAESLAKTALANGSSDNLSIQIVRVEALPDPDAMEFGEQLGLLRPPPVLSRGVILDAYEIQRVLHSSPRSHIYLARCVETQERVVIKSPGQALREDQNLLERFMLDEWVARRVTSPHLLAAPALKRERSRLYSVSEFIDGITLEQWIIDHPRPDIQTVRKLIEQIVLGLRALHRQEMLHQDLRPANIMLDALGTLKIIDYGSVRVAGIVETNTRLARQDILGTASYTAPEYYIGEPASERSDQFSLAVIAYQMLSGKLPYANAVARCTSRKSLRRLKYQSICLERPDVPIWIDAALRKALHPRSDDRYEALSEFLQDLKVPNPALAGVSRPPLIERNPLAFWQGLCLVLSILLAISLAQS
jgi:serine/threonine protein kinase/serine/threonine protein phosphatase PrpC